MNMRYFSIRVLNIFIQHHYWEIWHFILHVTPGVSGNQISELEKNEGLKFGEFPHNPHILLQFEFGGNLIDEPELYRSPAEPNVR